MAERGRRLQVIKDFGGRAIGRVALPVPLKMDLIGRRRGIVGFDKGNVYEMFANEPNLEFVGAQNVANDDIVSPVVTLIGGAFCEFAAVANDDLMCIQQAGYLDWNLFPAPWRALNLGSFGDVVSHGERHSTEQLDAFCNCVHEFVLLFVVLVEQEVQLIKGGARNLPVRLLVKVAKGDGVGEELIEAFGHFQPHWLFQLDGQCVSDGSVLLNFLRPLVDSGLSGNFGATAGTIFLLHRSLLDVEL